MQVTVSAAKMCLAIFVAIRHMGVSVAIMQTSLSFRAMYHKQGYFYQQGYFYHIQIL